MSQGPSNPVQIIRNDYTSTNVTTGAWVQLSASLPEYACMLEIYDSSTQTLKLGYGPSGSEKDLLIIVPGGNGKVPVVLDKGMRLVVRALSGTASTGELDINLFK